MSPWISVAISCVALLVSGFTAWLTYFRRGKLLMTQPTVIFFGPDGPSLGSSKNKIYLRTLLYSSAKRGQVLESLYVSLQRNESKQNFNIWVYGENGNLKRGSGLFVPQEGVTFDHHFLLPEDGADLKFLSGNYKLKVYAKTVEVKRSREILSLELNINDGQAKKLSEPNTGLYFDWGPDLQSYHPHTDNKLERDMGI
jgi:hypothetical protein